MHEDDVVKLKLDRARFAPRLFRILLTDGRKAKIKDLSDGSIYVLLVNRLVPVA